MPLTTGEFERLAVEQRDTLYRVARRLVRDSAAAEDLVQETYVRALRAKGDFQLQSWGIRPWLLKILHNLHRSRTRDESLRPQTADDQTLIAAAGPAPDAPIPWTTAGFEHMDQQLVQAVETLPPDFAQPLLLWAVEDLTYHEIAEVLDLPLGTMMSRLHRARRRLAGQFLDFAL